MLEVGKKLHFHPARDLLLCLFIYLYIYIYIVVFVQVSEKKTKIIMLPVLELLSF